MSLGPVILDIAGTELTQEDREVLGHPAVGGIILFSRNYHSATQLADLVRQIKGIKSPSLLVCVDQEGGKVQRFVDGFVTLPPVQRIGELDTDDPQTAKNLATVCARVLAQQLLACGIDFSFAPVLDLLMPQSTVIAGLQRSFSRDPEIVTKLAGYYIDAMNEVGMQAVGKHFPGHGSAAGDSHEAILRDQRSLAQIEQTDLIPFKNLADCLAGIMIAHVIYPQVDDKPAGFSSIWVNEILRQQLHFKGLIFTDALDMQGAATVSSYAERVSIALAAGCDMALICNNRDAAIEVLDQAEFPKNDYLAQRQSAIRGNFNYSWKEMQAMPEWRMAEKLIAKYR